MPARSSRVRLQVQPSLLTKRKRPSCTERGPRSNGKTTKGWLCYAGRCLTGKWSRERDSNPRPALLRKLCSLSHLAPRHPDAPHFISEIHPGHPPAPSLGSPSADNFVGKWSATSTREVTPARRCLDQMRPAVLVYNPHVPPTSRRSYWGDDR